MHRCSRARVPGAAAAVVLLALLLVWPAPRARAAQHADLCASLATQDVTATATLRIEGRTGRAVWASSHLQMAVPRSWEGAAAVLSGRMRPTACLPGVTATSTSDIRVAGDHVMLSLEGSGPLSSAHTWWTVDHLDPQALDGPPGTVTFAPPALEGWTWSRIVIDGDRHFTVERVFQTPASFNGDELVRWTDYHPPVVVAGTFPGPTVQLASTSWMADVLATGDRPVTRGVLRILSGAVLYGAAALVFLRRRVRARRRVAPEGSGTPQDHGVLAAGTSLAVAGVLYQVALVLSPDTGLYQLVVLAVAGLLVWMPVPLMRPRDLTRARSRWLAWCLAVGWVVGGTEVANVVLPEPVAYSEVLALYLLGLLVVATVLSARRLAWVHPQDGDGRRLLARLWWIVVLVTVPLIAFGHQFGLTAVVGFSLSHLLQVGLAAVMVVHLTRDVDQPLSDVGRETGPLVIVLAVALLEALRWDYSFLVGLALPVLVVAVVWGCLAALRASGPWAVLARVGEHEARAAAGEGSVEQLQAGLIAAQDTLRGLRAERKALEKGLADGAVTTEEAVPKRRRIEWHIRQLRRLPPGSIEPTPPPPRSPLARLRIAMARLLGSGARPDAPAGPDGRDLPARLDPGDVALSFGPAGHPPGNGARAFHVTAMLGLLPAAYFLSARLAGDDSAFIDPSVVIELAISEFAFWGLTGFVLGYLWAVLPTRRGSTKALLVWVVYVAVVLLLAGVSAATLAAVPEGLFLRGTMLVFVLLVVGLLMDLLVLRPAGATTPLIGYFAEYYRLNRVVPILTLVVPLVASALAIWREIDRPPASVTPAAEEQQDSEAQAGRGS